MMKEKKKVITNKGRNKALDVPFICQQPQKILKLFYSLKPDLSKQIFFQEYRKKYFQWNSSNCPDVFAMKERKSIITYNDGNIPQWVLIIF